MHVIKEVGAGNMQYSCAFHVTCMWLSHDILHCNSLGSAQGLYMTFNGLRLPQYMTYINAAVIWHAQALPQLKRSGNRRIRSHAKLKLRTYTLICCFSHTRYQFHSWSYISHCFMYLLPMGGALCCERLGPAACGWYRMEWWWWA